MSRSEMFGVSESDIVCFELRYVVSWSVIFLCLGVRWSEICCLGVKLCVCVCVCVCVAQ